MSQFPLKVALVAVVILSWSSSALAQTNPYKAVADLPPGPRAIHVRITKGPELESATTHSAIIRWTSDNPGGSDEHFGVITFGTDPKNLSETAKSHIRLNRNHPYTVFRVWVDGLQPLTTYYYTVDSMEADGTRDEVKSPGRHFTTR